MKVDFELNASHRLILRILYETTGDVMSLYSEKALPYNILERIIKAIAIASNEMHISDFILTVANREKKIY